MTVLEYLLIYTQSGLPIYSKCYDTFCKAAFKNPELLTGFLSAVETIPLTISSDFTLKSVKMGNSEMRFTKTTPGGHSVVIGLSEDAPDVANEVFSAVSGILASGRFVNQDWSVISSDLMASFEEELLESSLPKALHDYGALRTNALFAISVSSTLTPLNLGRRESGVQLGTNMPP